MKCPNCGFASVPTSEKAKGGKPPYGFRAVDGKIAFCQIYGPVLATILRWNTNYGTRTIAQSLNAQGVKSPAGKEWSHGSVARVIRQGKKYSHLIPLEYVLN